MKTYTPTWEQIRNKIPGLKARLSNIGKFNQDTEYPNPRVNEWGVINHIQYNEGEIYGEITLSGGYSFDFDTLEEIEIEPAPGPTPEAPDKIPSAEEYVVSELRLYLPNPTLNTNVLSQVVEDYALLREQRAVEQAKEQKIQLLENIIENFNGVHSDYYAEIVETVIQDLKHGI